LLCLPPRTDVGDHRVRCVGVSTANCAESVPSAPHGHSAGTGRPKLILELHTRHADESTSNSRINKKSGAGG
jgi:hypothetical protein